MRHLTNIFRRLYRIFAHAWFQHREVFWQVEGHEGLYIFFKTVSDMYSLIPEDNYTIPAEAEGIDPQQLTEQADGRRLTILRKEGGGSLNTPLEAMEPSSISTGATTRRHKNSPSTSSRVTTISESAEDDEQHPRESPQAATEAAQKAPEEIKPEEKIEPEPEPKQTDPEPEVPAPVASEEQPGAIEETSVHADGSQITVAEVPEDEDAPKESEEKPESKEQEPAESSAEKTKTEEHKDAATASVETAETEPEAEPEKPVTAPEETQAEAAAEATET